MSCLRMNRVRCRVERMAAKGGDSLRNSASRDHAIRRRGRHFCSETVGRREALSRAIQTELWGDGAERIDAEGDVFFERHAEFFGTFVDIIAADAAGEGFVFQFFLYRGGFDFVNAFAGLDQGASGEK